MQEKGNTSEKDHASEKGNTSEKGKGSGENLKKCFFDEPCGEKVESFYIEEIFCTSNIRCMEAIKAERCIGDMRTYLLPILVTVQQITYRLTVISEEEVPLAAGAEPDYFVIVLMVMGLLLIIIFTGIYAKYCEQYRKRIQRMDSAKKAYHGWVIWKLKDEIIRLENEKLEGMC